MLLAEGILAARFMKALLDRASVTFWVQNVPTTESSTEPPHF